MADEQLKNKNQNNSSCLNEENEENEKSKEIEKLKKEIEELKTKCEDYLNGWKRERADFLNYKKEELERINGIIKYANESLILKILEVLDNLYLAETHLPENLKENKWIEGFFQVKKQLLDLLTKEGVEALEVMGKKFDPSTMEAVEEIEVNKEEGKESGIVIEEVQKGYTLEGKLIRPAKVKISK